MRQADLSYGRAQGQGGQQAVWHGWQKRQRGGFGWRRHRRVTRGWCPLSMVYWQTFIDHTLQKYAFWWNTVINILQTWRFVSFFNCLRSASENGWEPVKKKRKILWFWHRNSAGSTLRMCSVLPRDTLISLDAGESKVFLTVSFPDPPHQVELRSSGGAGEYQGDEMGVYQLLPEHRGQGGGAAYRQLHDTNDQHNYLYRFDIVVAQPWR